MVLKHHTIKTVKGSFTFCKECLLRPDQLFTASKYTAFVEKVAENVYHVRFVWRKLGMTRKFDVILKVIDKGDTVIYETVEGSKYPMKFVFNLRRKGENLEVEVSSEMKAGLMADLLGRKDYAGFVEELVETGLIKLAEKLASEMGVAIGAGGENAVCSECLLYDPARSYCYYLREYVANPESPPCGGKRFISEEAVLT